MTRVKGSEKKRYEKVLQEVRDLLAVWQSAGVDLFMRLREIDRGEEWIPGGHSSFQNFLKSEFPDVIGIERYNNVIRSIDVYGEDFVRKVGINMPVIACDPKIARDEARKAEVVAAVEYHIREEGCAPGEQKIRKIALDVAPEIRKPCKEVKAARKLSQEQTEIARLRRQVAALKKENSELKKEIRRLNKQAKKSS
jgi:hypothetical protein